MLFFLLFFFFDWMSSTWFKHTQSTSTEWLFCRLYLPFWLPLQKLNETENICTYIILSRGKRKCEMDLFSSLYQFVPLLRCSWKKDRRHVHKHALSRLTGISTFPCLVWIPDYARGIGLSVRYCTFFCLCTRAAQLIIFSSQSQFSPLCSLTLAWQHFCLLERWSSACK